MYSQKLEPKKIPLQCDICKSTGLVMIDNFRVDLTSAKESIILGADLMEGTICLDCFSKRLRSYSVDLKK